MTLHNTLIGVDLHGAKAFTGVGSPVGVRVPGIVGEMYYDTAAKHIWTAFGLLNTDWTDIGPGSPSIHHLTHQNGGTDEIAVAVPAPFAIPKALGSGMLATGWIPATAPAPHAASHQNGGTDEVAVVAPAADAIPKATGTGTLMSGWLPAATETARGATEIATQVETDTGTDDTRIVSPLKLATTPRLPTQSENDALVGTSGAPSAVNPYVTSADPRNTNARTPTAHAASHQNGGTDEVATAVPAANAIPKAGGTGTLSFAWLPAASEATQGAAEIATQAETDTGTDDLRIVTPLKLRTDITSTVRPEVATDDFGVHSFGPLRSYAGAQGSPQSANEVQYMRVWLRAGITITKMRTFIAAGANAVRQIQFAIYDQVTPTSDSQGPNNRVATTAADTPPNLFTGIRDVNLTASYAVTTSGWYHFALQVSDAIMSFLISDTFRASTVPRREETPGGFALPATAGATTQPQSAALYCAAVE